MRIFVLTVQGERSTVHKLVYLARHGESEANAFPRYQPPNSPLTEKGRRQAQLIAKRALQLQFDALISSPYTRARETAETIADITECDIEYSDLFVERMKPTSINGKQHTDPVPRATWQRWEVTLYEPGIRVEDGENFDDLVARADRVLAFLEGHPGRSLLVVTHGFFMRTLISRIVMREALSGSVHKQFQSSLSVQNTGITAIKLESNSFEPAPRWRVFTFNDHAHLV